MKVVIPIILSLVLLTGCKLLGIGYDIYTTIVPVFNLTDTTGHTVRKIPSGEPFDLSFSLKNTTKDTLNFNSATPVIYFELFRNGSIVSVSDLNCTYFLEGILVLYPGQSITRIWKAPASFCSPGQIYLLPAEYTAKVFYPSCPQVKIISPGPIKFSITPSM